MTHHSAEAWETSVSLLLDADFADLAEVGGERQQRGTISRSWDPARRALVLEYRAKHAGRAFERAVRVRVVASTSDPAGLEEGLRFHIRLEPGREWSSTLAFESFVDGRWRCPSSHDPRSRQRAAWRSVRPTLDGPDRLKGVFDRARRTERSRSWLPPRRRRTIRGATRSPAR